MTATTLADDAAIVALLHRYFDGLYQGDVAALREVFHPSARLTGVVKGVPYAKDVSGYLEVVASRESPRARGEDFLMRIETVEQAGDIAIAKLRCPMLGYNYRDFLSLTREDGRWSVSHKLFTHIEG